MGHREGLGTGYNHTSYTYTQHTPTPILKHRTRPVRTPNQLCEGCGKRTRTHYLYRAQGWFCRPCQWWAEQEIAQMY